MSVGKPFSEPFGTSSRLDVLRGGAGGRRSAPAPTARHPVPLRPDTLPAPTWLLVETRAAETNGLGERRSCFGRVRQGGLFSGQDPVRTFKTAGQL